MSSLEIAYIGKFKIRNHDIMLTSESAVPWEHAGAPMSLNTYAYSNIAYTHHTGICSHTFSLTAVSHLLSNLQQVPVNLCQYLYRLYHRNKQELPCTYASSDIAYTHDSGICIYTARLTTILHLLTIFGISNHAFMLTWVSAVPSKIQEHTFTHASSVITVQIIPGYASVNR